MKNWPASRSFGGYLGLLIVVSLLGGAAFLSYSLFDGLGLTTKSDPEISLYTYAKGVGALSLFILAVIYGYWTFGFFNLRYKVDRNGLVIVWAGVKQFIPMSAITKVNTWSELVSGESLPETESASTMSPGTPLRGKFALSSGLPSFKGLINWPGYHVSSGQLPGLGPFVAYLTKPAAGTLVISTPTLHYLISPRNLEDFRKEFGLRRSLGMTSVVQQNTVRRSLIAASIWLDKTTRWLLLSAFLVNVLFFGYLCFKFNALPSYIPFHYHEELTVNDVTRVASPAVVVDRIDPKLGIFWFPIAGLLVIFFNVIFAAYLHTREQLAARILLGSSLAVQVVFWLAALAITLKS